MSAPARAILLAAGLGTRMRPLTERLPKPLVPVAGRTLLDRALDRLAAAGVERVVVNTHHLAPLIARHLAARTMPRIILSHEPEVLETGGGVLQALPHLVPGPFYVVNSDAIWLDDGGDALARLAATWDGARMDALLLVAPRASVIGYEGPGDFFLADDGRLARRAAAAAAPFVYIGAHLLSEALFAGESAGKFSLNRIWDKALAAGRLCGLRHEGLSFDVGTLAGVALAERALSGGSP